MSQCSPTPSSSARTNLNTSASDLRRLSGWLALAALACLFFADLEIHSPDPTTELMRMGQGLINPNFWSWSEIFTSALNTLAFALQGIFVASIAGFILALYYHSVWVRGFCAFIRAIHELFWALIFIQIFGLSPLTGLLAIAIPYAGTLAKIYGELFEETDPAPRNNLENRHLQSGNIESRNQQKNTDLSAFFYTTLPLAWQPLTQYTRYRLECAIRSSIVLGFIGLPTLGFHLETALSEGHYNDASALLLTLFLIIVTQRWWLKTALIPIYLLAAFIYLPPIADIEWQFVLRFFTEDIIPTPLKNSGDIATISPWLTNLWQTQIWPGISNTLILSQLALLLTGLLTLALFPLNARLFFNKPVRTLGDSLLIIGRTLPEYLLAFLGLLLFGPSMLPAILALGIHNGAIIAHLLGRYSNDLTLRDDAVTGLNRYAFEVLPRIYRQFLAFLLYRWEVIMRETAILGILGIGTLGFYIDSAFEEFRFDRAMVLILCAAALNILADKVSHFCRHRLHLKNTPETP